jgi:Leucine-rich repeat (LRR) protein
MVSNAGLKELHGLGDLQSLGLSHTKVTDAGLKELHELKRLQELDVSGTLVTEQGDKDLRAKMPKLTVRR